jgi:hypothetical protein
MRPLGQELETARGERPLHDTMPTCSPTLLRKAFNLKVYALVQGVCIQTSEQYVNYVLIKVARLIASDFLHLMRPAYEPRGKPNDGLDQLTKLPTLASLPEKYSTRARY